MAKFLLIDHSLRCPGAHHYEYAMQVLHAAENAGYEVYLATHRQFQGQDKLPSHWQTFSLFAHDTYSPHCLYFSEKYSVPASSSFAACRQMIDLPLRGVQRAIASSSRGRHQRQFTDACRELFQRVSLTAGDHVFLPTMSEFDLAGLVPALLERPQAQRANWHLQFHFDVFEGREPEYAAQSHRGAAMQEKFAKLLPHLPAGRTHFYNTTEQLAAQYNRLGIATFQPLPYPVSQEIQPRENDAHPRTLRVTCAGYLRREKGRHRLRRLIEELWPRHLATGRLQLVLQCQPARLKRLVSKQIARSLADWDDPHTAPLRCVPHPVSATGYVDLIRDSHLGLFLYESRRYYARCSGILLEMLSAGVPVIVPAGCWLAEQIAESNFRYLDDLQATLPSPSWRQPHLDVAWDTSQTIDMSWPAGATQMMISYKPTTPLPGNYVRFQLTFLDADGRERVGPANIVTTRGQGSARTMFDLEGTAARLAVASAYCAPRFRITDLSVRFVSPHDQRQAHYPHGSIGLTSADLNDLPRLIDEIVVNYEHYRANARRFSDGWRREHQAARVLEQLQRNARYPARSKIRRVA